MPPEDNKPVDSSSPSDLLGDGNFLFKDKENNRTVVHDEPVDPPAPIVGVDDKPVPPVQPPAEPPVNPPADPPKPADPPADPPADDIKSIVPDSILNPKPADGEGEEGELPDDMDEKAKNAFIKQRHALKEKDTLIKELEAKINEQGDPEVVVQLKTQLKEAHDKIGMLDLAQHPAFQSKYEVPKQAILTRVKSALTDAGVDASIADKAASMNLINRSNYLAEQVPDIKDALLPYFSQVDTLDAEKSAALENYKSTSEQLKTQMQTAETQQRAAFREKVVNTALANLQDSDHFAFRKGEGEGMAEWNKKVEATMTQGKELMNSDDVLSQAQFMIAGVAVPVYLEVIKSLTEQNKQYVAEIKKHRSANPSIGASGGEPNAPVARDKSKGMTPAEAAAQVAQQMEEKTRS